MRQAAMPVPTCAKFESSSAFLAAFLLLASGCQPNAHSAARDAGAGMPVDASAGAAATASDAPAPDKGPAHSRALPGPGEQAIRYLDDDDTWRYVAPPNPGRLYDALFFDGRWFVLHGLVQNSGKAVVSEINWLSWTRDGIDWDTITLTEEPFQSYTRLASNASSLLLFGSHGVGRFVGDAVLPVTSLTADSEGSSGYPPVPLAFPDGYAIARKDDIVWLSSDGSRQEQVLDQPLAQFRAGVARQPGQRSLFTGPFGTFESSDGKHWRALASAPCTGCNVAGIAYGNGRYLAADPVSLFVSSDGVSWQKHAWEPALESPDTPPDEVGEDRIARVDFTGGHFALGLEAGNMRISRDGETWSAQLKIPLGQIGPAACNGRCVAAAGRLVLPPRVLPDPEPPRGADESSPYYCEYLGPNNRCQSCVGATAAQCREGVHCGLPCQTDRDCPGADSGSARIGCAQTQVGGRCHLACDQGEKCPNGMTCVGGQCLYVFDDPRCVDAN